jgi:hypothetical protein
MVTFPSLSSQGGSFNVKAMGLTYFGKTSWCFLCKALENSNQRQYQQAYTVPTTKQKGKPSFMLLIPSAKLTTTRVLFF